MTDDPETTPAAGTVKPFAQFLQEQRNGNLHSELSEKLQELVAAVIEHDKGGTLTLTVSVKPAGNGINLVVSDDVKCKAPEADRPVALFYADSAGNLSRRDPRQPELPLREINDTSRKAG